MTQTSTASAAPVGDQVSATANERLLEPTKLGPYLLKNRFVLPPLTRSRAGGGDTPTELHAIYYAQRAEAGLLITEGSPISRQGTGFPWTPGIYSDAQIEGWRQVTAAVHQRGSRIFLQLWHVGRQSHTSLQEGGALPVAPSPIAVNGQIFTADGLQDFQAPRQLDVDEIQEIVAQFGDAARNAKEAGFDGVEIHGASGYLIDQFLCAGSNARTDEYGGSIENRTRFLWQVLNEVVSVWGPDRVGVRLTPSSVYGDMFSPDKREIYSAVVERLAEHDLAYLHLVEPTVSGSENVEAAADAIPTAHFRSLYPGTIIVAGGLTFTSAEQLVDDGVADLVAFGKAFMANPDLVSAYAEGRDIIEPERAHYYGGAEVGYTDYATARDKTYLEHLRGQFASGRMTAGEALAALEATPDLNQLDSGGYYARLALVREASAS